jgi:penicillin-binding protein 2
VKQAHRPARRSLDARHDLLAYSPNTRRFAILLTIPFLLLTARLWYLQLWQGDHYTQRAISNVIDRSPISPERGLIFDAKGRLLAENRPGYNAVIKPILFAPKKGRDAEEAAEELQSFNARLSLLQQHLSLTDDEVQAISKQVLEKQDIQRYKNLIVKRNITRDQVALITSSSLQLPGAEVVATSQRHYPFDDLASHVLGYMSEINADELKKLKPFGYQLADMIGKTGVERSFEAILRGTPGLHAEVVNARRIPQTDQESRTLLGDWKDAPPIPGKNIVLSVDMDLQRIMLDAMRNYPSGAAVALDPRNGRILGITSKPTFNPNSWSGRLSRDEHIENDVNLHKPMLDKSLSSYFPGSTYKIVTALAAIEGGLITPNETLYCPGYYEFGRTNKRFGCWKHSGHKNVNLAQSLEGSCDVYFYKLAEKIGMDRLAEVAREFGFGSSSGVGFGRESPGLVPTKEWYNVHVPDGFRPGLTLSTGIGQGDVHVSPLQLAIAFAAIANGGTVFYPSIIDHIETPDGQVIFDYPHRVRNRLSASPSTLHEIVKGLDLVVNSETGTAYAHRLDYVRVAGKTGTAQVRSQRIHNKTAEFKDRDHAWFAAFAPVQDPEIVVIVFLEHGGGGSSDAAPVAMEIIDRYFREIQGYIPMLASPQQPQPRFLEPPKAPTARGAIPGATQLGGSSQPSALPSSPSRWNR